MLRRHVQRRAEHLASHGNAGLLHDTGQAEIGDPQAPVVTEDQVVRLDVPVDDPFSVGVFEGVGGRRHMAGDGGEVLSRANIDRCVAQRDNCRTGAAGRGGRVICVARLAATPSARTR